MPRALGGRAREEGGVGAPSRPEGACGGDAGGVRRRAARTPGGRGRRLRCPAQRRRPAYQLAVVVDDAEQGVGEVVRGADLADSTPRQILLYDLLGLPVPRYAHVPLVLGPDGRRLAKRHGAVTLANRRATGQTPERVLRWMALSLGLAEPGERPGLTDLLARFDPARLPQEPTVWDPTSAA
nr:glutamate--tRNA ligase family protein [Rubrobacter marinus]